MKTLFFAILIANLLIFIPYKANAMTVGEIVTYPFKIIAKPIQWWRYGWEKKVDEYKVEITYDLKFDNKPLTITKAINCEIFEGVFRWDSDGIKRPSRRVVESVRQITHEITKTGEVLILPIPGYCTVDKPFREKKVTTKNGKVKTEIIPIKNQTKSFSKLSDKVIQSPAIVKFSKENPKQIDYIERIISPKLYESKHAKIKIKSFSFRVESKEMPINTKLADPKIENRFAWINGEAKTNKLPRWGTYKDEDKGIYSAFGMFKYPKEIWSKIPTINDFITKVLDQAKNSKKQKDLIYFSYDSKEYQELGVAKVIKDAKRYLADLQSYHSLDRYFGKYGINEVDTSVARIITIGTDIMKKEGNGKWVVAKEMEWRQLVKNSNYRDYYYPFIFNKKERIWEEAEDKKGLLLIYRTSDGKNANSNITVYHRTTGDFKIKNRKFDKKTEFMLYDSRNEELILVPDGNGFILK